jgi:hypothetical protein
LASHKQPSDDEDEYDSTLEEQVEDAEYFFGLRKPEPFFGRLKYYIGPSVECKNRSCQLFINLPYPEAIEIPTGSSDDPKWSPEYERLLESPPERWSATLACSKCGHVDAYDKSNVRAYFHFGTDKQEGPSPVDLFRVEFPCADLRCKAPISIFVSAKKATERDVLAMLRNGSLRWKMPCGHFLSAVPHKLYKIGCVTNRLW